MTLDPLSYHPGIRDFLRFGINSFTLFGSIFIVGFANVSGVFYTSPEK